MAAPRTDTDLVVVGGGPAGLAVAIRAHLAGLRAIVLDRARPPIDKACGEGLMPDGVQRLRESGVELDPLDARAFCGIRYVDGETVAEGRFPGAPGLGVRRPRLHAALVARAEQLAVDLRWGVRVDAVADGVVRTDRGELRGRWIAAADGLHSRVRRQAGLQGRPARRRRFGVRRHYATAPWSDRVEVHWAHGAEAYVTPVGPGSVGVAMLWSGGPTSFDRLLACFPTLERRLHGLPTESADRGAGPLEQRVRGVVRGRLALVGDASGYVDALTGEGLSIAFHQARALVEALVADDLSVYAREHRRIVGLPARVTRLLLLVERRPRLRRRVVRALARDPDGFSRLLAVCVKDAPATAGLPRLLSALALRALVLSAK